MVLDGVWQYLQDNGMGVEWEVNGIMDQGIGWEMNGMGDGLGYEWGRETG